MTPTTETNMGQARFDGHPSSMGSPRKDVRAWDEETRPRRSFTPSSRPRSSGTSETVVSSQERRQDDRPGQTACQNPCKISETCVVRLITQRQLDAVCDTHSRRQQG